MFTIAKEFKFDASHQLKGLPEGHPCGRLHGHTYKVIVELQGPKLDEKGFILDYGDLKPIKDYIDTHLDHHHLNEMLLVNPTAELIAYHIYKHFKNEFPQLIAVTVKETENTFARYEPEDHRRTT